MSRRLEGARRGQTLITGHWPLATGHWPLARPSPTGLWPGPPSRRCCDLLSACPRRAGQLRVPGPAVWKFGSPASGLTQTIVWAWRDSLCMAHANLSGLPRSRPVGADDHHGAAVEAVLSPPVHVGAQRFTDPGAPVPVDHQFPLPLRGQVGIPDPHRVCQAGEPGTEAEDLHSLGGSAHP